MPKPLVVITRDIAPAGIKLLSDQCELKIHKKDRPLPRAKLLKFVRGADALICCIGDRIDQPVLESAGPQLKIVANANIGYDNVDVSACAARHVLVSNAPGPVNVTDVADHAIGLMLAVARRIPEADRFTRSGKYRYWSIYLMAGRSVAGKTLGIVGTGRIGSAVAQRAAGFSMPILYYDALGKSQPLEEKFGAKFVPLDELLRAADFITIHVPLLPTTRHLISTREFSMMKPTAVLVNTSRGPIVDEKALVRALKTNQIAGAGLDVYENEPKLAPGLAKLKNVVLTPHTASATLEARNELSAGAAKNVLAALAGQPLPNAVTK